MRVAVIQKKGARYGCDRGEKFCRLVRIEARLEGWRDGRSDWSSVGRELLSVEYELFTILFWFIDVVIGWIVRVGGGGGLGLAWCDKSRCVPANADLLRKAQWMVRNACRRRSLWARWLSIKKLAVLDGTATEVTHA